MRRNKKDDIWRLAAVGSLDECWPWQGSVDHRGYGYFSYRGRTHKAHRIAYEVAKGDIGNNYVCHSCDNPSCVNPNHLWLGTALQNAADRERKNRHSHPPTRKPRSVCPAGHKLTEDNLVRCKLPRRTCLTCQRKHSREAKRRERDRSP